MHLSGFLQGMCPCVMEILLIAFGLVLAASAPAYSLAVKDTIPDDSVSGRVQISNMGFAPVPAFSFNSPIVIGFLSVKKKRFNFEPDAAVGLNGKPWMTNNWFRYTLSERKNRKATLGVNPSLFFKNETLSPGEAIVLAHRNMTLEVAVESTLFGGRLWFTYTNIRAFDKGMLSGNFLDVSGRFTIASIREKLVANFTPQVFYFNFDGNVDGLFASSTIRIEHVKLPLSFYTQGVLPIWSNFPGNRFKWNFGVFMTFK